VCVWFPFPESADSPERFEMEVSLVWADDEDNEEREEDDDDAEDEGDDAGEDAIAR